MSYSQDMYKKIVGSVIKRIADLLLVETFRFCRRLNVLYEVIAAQNSERTGMRIPVLEKHQDRSSRLVRNWAIQQLVKNIVIRKVLTFTKISCKFTDLPKEDDDQVIAERSPHISMRCEGGSETKGPFEGRRGDRRLELQLSCKKSARHLRPSIGRIHVAERRSQR